jgi:hypothetical protein
VQIKKSTSRWAKGINRRDGQSFQFGSMQPGRAGAEAGAVGFRWSSFAGAVAPRRTQLVAPGNRPATGVGTTIKLGSSKAGSPHNPTVYEPAQKC